MMDAKRRREFLEWALGKDLSILTGTLKVSIEQLSSLLMLNLV